MTEKDQNDIPRLLVSAREAAASLGISERSLWSMTVPRGSLPCVRFGRMVRYRVEDLNTFVTSQTLQQDTAHDQERYVGEYHI